MLIFYRFQEMTSGSLGSFVSRNLVIRHLMSPFLQSAFITNRTSRKKEGEVAICPSDSLLMLLKAHVGHHTVDLRRRTPVASAIPAVTNTRMHMAWCLWHAESKGPHWIAWNAAPRFADIPNMSHSAAVVVHLTAILIFRRHEQ